MLQEALNHAGADISHLLPLPPPAVDDRVPVGKLPKGDLSVDLPEFSIQCLHEFLVNFIVSNDQVRLELKRAIGVISFTADIWSADKLDSYLVMMAHWIRHESGGMQPHSGQLTMKATLITFHCLPTSHMGKEIAKAPLHLIDHAETPVEKTFLAFCRPEEIHQGFSRAWNTLWQSKRTLSTMDRRLYDVSVTQTIESGNANQSFMHGGVPSPLPVVQLLHDIGTHWDSTYYMINCPGTLCQAVDLWVRVPQNVPAMAHHMMTLEHIPLLSGALPAYETFLEQWRISMSSTNPQFSPLLREGLAHGERYHKLMHANKAYCSSIQTPTLCKVTHPSICFSWVEHKWCDEISSIKASILELMHEYHMKYANSSAQLTPTTMQPAYMG
ncbi:hypothetical protein EDC04DRAFT_2601246 [Pisolithus marmoratus]|nr:hypothetical protein EDC04DRAFT_2601246 [Pisolithus marmoratus]